MRNVRQGKCDFSDYGGQKHTMTWTVEMTGNMKVDKRKLIKKTDICMLRIMMDDTVCISFDEGVWHRRPPLFGLGRDAYNMVMALYS